MTRRKKLAPRKPSGRISIKAEPSLPSPTETHRLREAALAGLRDAVWATTIGQLYNTGRINGAEFIAARRWAELAADFSAVCLSPKPPRSARLAVNGGSPLDPDSAGGRREALQDARLAADYVEAYALLEHMGAPARRAVIDTCEYGLYPVGFDGHNSLRKGLQGLAIFWKVK